MSDASCLGMDSQDDSIDIAKLQRVALGLEHEHSQSILDKVRTIAQASQDRPSKPPHTDHAIPRASASPVPQTPSRFSHPNGMQQSYLEPRGHNDGLASQPGKMSSAETAPGDTQVVSQSVFDSIIRQNKDSSGVQGLENAGDGGTFRTLHEGDTGHIDLLSGFDNAHQNTAPTEENDDDSSSKLGESSPTYYEPNLFPESQRFMTTPAPGLTQTHADARSTETPLVSRNPLTADTEASGGVMALSQVFKATQVPSSPLVNNALQTDPMSDRPSPNVPLQSHPLPGALSSPFMSIPTKLHRKSSEPHYISMDESQAERDRLLRQRMTRSADHVNAEDQSDSEFSKEPSFVRRLRRQKMIDEEANEQFASLAAAARPSSRSAKNGDVLRASPRGEPGRRERSSSRGRVLDYEPRDFGAVNQNGTTSEEETEQEEDLGPVHPSQEPHTSTEEDKENYNELPAPDFSAAAGSHGRLTQALALSESKSPQDRRLVQGPANSRCPRSSNRDEEAFIVQDSQQSPSRQESPEGSLPKKPCNEGAPRHPFYPFSDLDKVPSSPIMKASPRSSPPSSAHRDPASSHAHGRDTDTREELDVGNSHDSSGKHADIWSHNSRPQLSDPASQKPTDVSVNPSAKSSSLLSQIAETPLGQHSGSSRDITTATSIPDTSPNRSPSQNWASARNGEVQNQEDDDLPPMYPAGHERAGQLGLSDAQRSLLASKNIHDAKILSSPSGRPRRALTEIASDVSPQMEFHHYNVDFGIFTAEDQEFNSLVSASPIPPRKKRRRNINRDIYASDSLLADVPQAPKPQPVNVQQEEAMEGDRVRAESASVSEETFLTQSSPLKQADSASEVYAIRQSNVRRVGRPPKSASRRRGRPPGTRKARDVFAKAVVIHTRRSNDHSNSQSNAPTIPENADKILIDTSVDTMYTDPKPPIADGGKILQNQVLAPWSGKQRAYYAGTCYGAPAGTSPSRYLVKFEDSAPVEVSVSSVKRMELRVGDGVKVDMPGVPKIAHIIRGFADKLSEEELGKRAANGLIPLTDVHGHSSVVLGPKQRKSIPGGGVVADNVMTIPMSKIYLDNILWNQLKDREFTYSSETFQLDSRRRTPSDEHSAPTSPSTRLSRSIHPSTSLFSGMAFAVSCSDNEDSKLRITRLILENGGRILKDGFNELFEYPSSVPLAIPAEADPDATENGHSFRLGSAAEEIGFACLIADKHSRREKYMQALALNLPCLSGRWIEDCASQRRVLDWGMYLLPAGESLYLDGATKSRVLTPTRPTTARLSDTVAGRPKLLAGQSVLLVMGRGRAEEKRRAYIFLTYALGASKMQHVLDLKSAKTVLDQQADWDWIYVDDDEQDAARAMILGASADVRQQPARRGRKRKRTSESVDSSGGGIKARIMGNEFLCQSLILGRLFE